MLPVLSELGAGCLGLPRDAPSLGELRIHARADKAVPDGRSTGLVDAFGVSAAAH